jgi:two-component system cell cycle sensor histidine kinase/response regulator CckA
MIEPEVTVTKTEADAKPVVYVVDDEPMLLELATIILDPLGYQICTFRNPEAALAAFAQAQPRPDLVITDYAMHTMNGMELIQECRRLQPTQKILLLSGTVGEEVFQGASSKPDQFLAKPYYARQLIDLVKGMLAG